VHLHRADTSFYLPFDLFISAFGGLFHHHAVLRKERPCVGTHLCAVDSKEAEESWDGMRGWKEDDSVGSLKHVLQRYAGNRLRAQFVTRSVGLRGGADKFLVRGLVSNYKVEILFILGKIQWGSCFGQVDGVVSF
jgi:hypothetical protein